MFKGELTSDAVRWLDADGDVFAAVSSSFWRLFFFYEIPREHQRVSFLYIAAE